MRFWHALVRSPRSDNCGETSYQVGGDEPPAPLLRSTLGGSSRGPRALHLHCRGGRSPLSFGDEKMTALQHERFEEAFSSGRIEEAERICSLALEESPVDWNALYLLGVIHRVRGDFRGALTRYHQALRFNSQSAGILRACGIAHQQLGEFDKAISAFVSSLREEPDSIEGLNCLALTYRKMNQFHHALYYYCVALNLCMDAAQAKVKAEGLISEQRDERGRAGTMIEGQAVERFRLAVLATPYFGFWGILVLFTKRRAILNVLHISTNWPTRKVRLTRTSCFKSTKRPDKALDSTLLPLALQERESA